MSTSHTPPSDLRSPPSDESVRRGHEIRDVNPRAVLWLGVGVLGTTAVVLAIVWLVVQGLAGVAERSDSPRSPLAAESPEPPPPHLQDQPQQEYLDYRREQEQRLNSYGWIDRQQGVVRIPIARAMELIAEQEMDEK